MGKRDAYPSSYPLRSNISAKYWYKGSGDKELDEYVNSLFKDKEKKCEVKV